jgi:hypothetical protein
LVDHVIVLEDRTLDLVKVPGARGSILTATWERGNRFDPSARVTGKIGLDKSYEKLAAAGEQPVSTVGPYDEKYLERFHQKWRGASKAYADLRRHGKSRCRGRHHIRAGGPPAKRKRPARQD